MDFSTGPELDLHKFAIDEALWEVEQFLKDSYQARITSVRIVHGKGTGALRKAIREWLPRHNLVRSFRQASDFEGGSGVTIVELVS